MNRLSLTRNIARTAKSTFVIGRITCSADNFEIIENSIRRMNIYVKNQPLHKAENRYWAAFQTSQLPSKRQLNYRPLTS